LLIENFVEQMAATFADDKLGAAEAKRTKTAVSVSEPTLSEEDVKLVHSCDIYEMEYDHCKRRRSRVHQKFVDGQKQDCNVFKQLFEECKNYDLNGDAKSGQFLVNYEKAQRRGRQMALLQNNVWDLRTEPPADFNAELPEYLQKRQKGTHLDAEQRAIDRQKDGVRSRYEQIRAQIGWDRGGGCAIM